jgi:hypothetical protein
LIGDKLEKAGWRQGAIVKPSDNAGLLKPIDHKHDDELILIIASQSCDIANNNIESDPYIEVSVARCVDKLNGNLTYNKNPRTLHARLQVCTEDADIVREQYIEIKAFEKLCVSKEYFENLAPNESALLNDIDLEGYVAWLAARYSRPALPTAFNDRLSVADPKDKLRKKAKGTNEHLSGIYVEIIPDAEISKEQNYKVNLLGFLSAGFEGDFTKVKAALEEYAVVMREANMDVTVALRMENDVSIAVIKRFKRFYYDDLSFKTGAPLPPEVEGVL